MSPRALATIVLASLAAVACKRGGVALDQPFFELQGRVRAVTWTGGTGLTSGQWDFSEDGKMVRGAWEVTGRDRLSGRIKSASLCEVDNDSREEFNVALEFTLDRGGNLLSALNRNDFGEYEYVLERGSDGRVSQTSVRDLEDSVAYIYNFSGYTCDSLGNWVSRRYTVTCEGKVVNSGAESRDIVYYDE